MKESISENTETLIIPKGFFVSFADFDSENPYIELKNDDPIKIETFKVSVPSALAYYLSTNYCGSQKMERSLISKGENNMKIRIKKIFDWINK